MNYARPVKQNVQKHGRFRRIIAGEIQFYFRFIAVSCSNDLLDEPHATGVYEIYYFFLSFSFGCPNKSSFLQGVGDSRRLLLHFLYEVK